MGMGGGMGGNTWSNNGGNNMQQEHGNGRWNGWRKQMGWKSRKQLWWWQSRWVQTRLPRITEVGRKSEREQQRYGWRNEGEEVLRIFKELLSPLVMCFSDIAVFMMSILL